MPNYELQIALEVRAPLLTRSSAMGHWLFDASIDRDAKGRPRLSGKLIHGCVREAWIMLGLEEWVVLLGESSDRLASDPRNSRRSGCLLFDEAFRITEPRVGGEKAPSPLKIRHRTPRDARTGAAGLHLLAALECPWPTGTRLEVTGSAWLVATGSEEAEAARKTLQAGLRWLTQIGGEKSVGFGEVLEASVSVRAEVLSGVQVQAGCTSVPITLRPRSGFCLARHRIDANLYESEEIISGGAIKGCLAEAWRQRLGLKPDEAREGVSSHPLAKKDKPVLARWFDALVFRHAFPSSPAWSARPVTPPKSIAFAGKQWFDLASRDPGKPVLIAGIAPAFSPDWKPEQNAQDDFGWVRPERELRVRSAHDPRRRRAEDEKLFAHEVVLPTTRANGLAQRVEWRGRIELSSIPEGEERSRLAVELAALLVGGLRGLGKTKAVVDVSVSPTGPPASGLGELGERTILTLQTPALLADPRALGAGAGEWMSSSGRLWRSYANVWSELSEGSLKLDYFYASQSLAGGEFLWRRFQFENAYNPWLLTDAGSVFVCTVLDRDKASAFLTEAQTLGLALPQWVLGAYGLLPGAAAWRGCPYAPENGFGEVAVDLPCHRERAPVEVTQIPVL